MALKAEKLLPDKPICPHGVEARFCKHQESYFDMRRGLPSSVEDIQFYCNANPTDCKWQKNEKLKGGKHGNQHKSKAFRPPEV